MIEARIDSALSLSEALSGKVIPVEITETLELITVRYLSFDGLIHQGQTLIHKDLAREVEEIFEELFTLSFPIEKVIPVCKYGWDDLASMADNNSSGFNPRYIHRTNRISKHSYGIVVDINTKLNPCVQNDGYTIPHGATYDPAIPGTFRAGSPEVEVFTKRGWTWGGTWQSLKDWQHFEKDLPLERQRKALELHLQG